MKDYLTKDYLTKALKLLNTAGMSQNDTLIDSLAKELYRADNESSFNKPGLVETDSYADLMTKNNLTEPMIKAFMNGHWKHYNDGIVVNVPEEPHAGKNDTQKGRYGASYKVDTQADFAERALNNYLSYNEDKIMEALDGNEAVFDAKKHEAYNALYDYDTLDHDEGDLDVILDNIFEIGNDPEPLGTEPVDDNPTGIANPADYIPKIAFGKEKEPEDFDD